ncbi:MAG: hypothetical protein M5R40_28645 [Anaerolineae bacterium]|nr:hypothetical protein [Anaerolineae bacterium]
MALALDAARLFDQTQATLQETDVLYKASQALGAAEDEKAVLEAVARYPLDMRAATATLWYMHTSERGAPEALEMAAFCGSDGAPPPDLDIGNQVAVDEMPASDLWLENPERPLFVEDTATDPRLRAELRAAMARWGRAR